ncbi:hypothetical protein ACTXT7_004826 [Hymenolepis weldensis]
MSKPLHAKGLLTAIGFMDAVLPREVNITIAMALERKVDSFNEALPKIVKRSVLVDYLHSDHCVGRYSPLS